MTLTQSNDKVEGTYIMGGASSTIQGTVTKRKLNFTYKETTASGKGWFELASDGQSFEGQWLQSGQNDWQKWEGLRASFALASKGGEEIAGLWNSTYGMMRLMESPQGVEGIYGEENTIKGKFQKGKFLFSYQEPSVSGEGWFELSADKQQISGKWRPNGDKNWANWEGLRINPVSGISWLVVIETPWETSLLQSEYSFGSMLKSFFTRVPQVQVRQRIVNSEADLMKYLKEVVYLPEPSVVTLSSHGTAEGIRFGNKLVSTGTIIESLKFASNLKLLHFGGCEIFKDGQMAASLKKKSPFPISGYKKAVDWAESAIFEFAYYEFLLARNMSVSHAVEQLRLIFPLASGKDIAGSPFKGMGFDIIYP